MTIDDISRYAYADEMPNTTMTCPEMLLWYQLRDIYELVKTNRWTLEQGQAAKEQTVNAFELHRKLYDWHNRLWIRIEWAAKEYVNHPGIDTADRFYEAVYGVIPNRSKEE